MKGKKPTRTKKAAAKSRVAKQKPQSPTRFVTTGDDVIIIRRPASK